MFKRILSVAILSTLLMLAACSGSYSRGQFTGYVVGATEQEIIDRIGKPDEIRGTDPDRLVWVFKKRTFDPDNLNQVDSQTSVIIERNAQGKLVGRDVLYG